MHVKNIKEQVRQNFSKAVDNYNQWAIVQKKAVIQLISFLDKKKYEDVLDVGCGTGFVIEELERKIDFKNITGLDFASNMISYCQSKWPEYEFICQDAECFLSDDKYDLIVSNFTWQWFENGLSSIKNFMHFLKDKGVLALSLPTEGSLDNLKKHCLMGKDIQSFLHRFPSQEEVICVIKSLSNVTLKYDSKKYVINYENPIAALQAIKKIGAHYKSRSMLSFKEIKSLNHEHYKNNKIKEFPLLYKVLFVIITKGGK